VQALTEKDMHESMDIYLCECSDRRCADPIGMTRPEYEAVPAVPVRFAIALDHENPEIDRVLIEKPRFATVESSMERGQGSLAPAIPVDSHTATGPRAEHPFSNG